MSRMRARAGDDRGGPIGMPRTHEKNALGIPALLSVGLGAFTSALDASVVNTVLPVIRDALHAPVETIRWVVTTCLLVMGGMLLTFGRLGDLRGHKRLYLSGFGVFLPASRGERMIFVHADYAHLISLFLSGHDFPAELRYGVTHVF